MLAFTLFLRIRLFWLSGRASLVTTQALPPRIERSDARPLCVPSIRTLRTEIRVPPPMETALGWTEPPLFELGFEPVPVGLPLRDEVVMDPPAGLRATEAWGLAYPADPACWGLRAWLTLTRLRSKRREGTLAEMISTVWTD